MLVLSRKADESIIIDGQITVTVLAVQGNRVRIGIEAPPRVSIHRGELEGMERESPLSQRERAASESLAVVG